MRLILIIFNFFLSNALILLLLTLIIATITLMERKILSLIQRRIGPNYIGYKGRFQFISDALKLLLKHIVVISKLNRVLFLISPVLVLITCYFFWVNIIWAPNLAICEIEYNLLFIGILSVITSSWFLLVGWTTKNKYAIISSNRVIVVVLNLEVLLTFVFIYIAILFESFSFFQVVSFQRMSTLGVFLLLPILPLLFVIFFLETSRIPFDLSESESELVAGYTTEMSGFFFALFYLGEYFHLFSFSFVYVILFLGAWRFYVDKNFWKLITNKF